MDAGEPFKGRIEGEGMNHYPHHIGDYLKDTAHLSLLEHGCYRRMLDVYYSREKAFADAGEACKLIGARTSQERAAVQLVLSDYFVQEADGFHQKRCDEELESYAAKANANRENGKKGGRPVTQAKPTNNPSGFDSLTQNNLNQNQNQNQNHNQIKESTSPASRPTPARKKTSLPSDFSVSPRVSAWATEKGYDRLQEHLDSFRLKCAAKGYENVDWDAAFMEAIRKDWAGLRNGSTAPVQSLAQLMDERDRRAAN